MSILRTVSVRGLLRVILRLRVPELGVFSRLLRQKRLMCPLLDHLAVAEHGDFVAEPAGRQPVADVDGRAVAGNGVELLVDLRLGNGVKGGGGIYVQGNAGYRAGIHMKAYQDQQPVIVIGGRAGSFLGEYQAGGTILVLGLHTDGKPAAGYFPCTGQHGGRVIFRGDVSAIRFPDQVTPHPPTAEELAALRPLVERWCALFGGDAEALMGGPFTVVTPDSKNPYRQMYAAN